MTIFRRPLYRFVLWAAIVVAVAAVTAAVGLAWWLIVVCVFVAWVVVTILERRLELRPTRAGAPAAGPAVPEPVAVPEPTVVRRRRFLPAPSSTPASVSAVANVSPSQPLGEKHWSIWTLDKVARENTDAELRFLVLSLQEYADADGMLPLQFDPLVRESFGELLGIATV